MTERKHYLSGTLLDDGSEYSLGELCRICGVTAETEIDMVGEGILEPSGSDPAQWRWEKLTVPRDLRGTPGILSISVSRLSRVRFKGTVRRVKVGAALAEIKTY